MSDSNELAEVPKKKHHFTALEQQKMQLEKLLEKVDKPVHIPERPGAKLKVKEPKDYVKNVQGSSAGAGSGEFHVYRAGRRREYARLKAMDQDAKEERDQQLFEQKIQEKRYLDEDKTEKNRAKRQRRKQRATNNRNSKRVANDARSESDEDEGERVQDIREKTSEDAKNKDSKDDDN
ncbi:hypothetical protein BGW38_000691 [Lunasporangiospora selenospora]|uniref:DUF1168 domain-containing protein n=1 Tax=Lunasporangiospora selenospora TaxID=979761 RepID=A0A9P6KID6_9FUNG|nr:hypothetical protein BGW38_000691 [Lunasporangiospora selenospora]